MRTKEEMKEYNKKWNENNKEKRKEYYAINKEKISKYYKIYLKEYRDNNKEKIKLKQKLYRENNKEKLKLYRENNKEKRKEYNATRNEKRKEHYAINKEKISEYYKNKRKIYPLFKLKCSLRNRTNTAFKRKNFTKSKKTLDMLGCDLQTAKAHLEKQFTKGMNWSNQGEWHIDHIIPCASAKTEEELIKLFHYTNLQPLWAADNLSKGKKIIEKQLFLL